MYLTAPLSVNLVNVVVTGRQQVSCPAGLSLLSCGIDNNIALMAADPNRYSVAINATSCECNDIYAAVCYVWCTNAVEGFEIMASPMITGASSVSCSSGKKVSR